MMGTKITTLISGESSKDKKQGSPGSPITNLENVYGGNPKSKLMKARFSFNSDGSDELSFVKGAVMEVLKEDGEWLYARDMTSKAKGFIPKNYFTQIDSLDNHDWYHGSLDRKDAEKFLLNQRPGTFMVRDSCTHNGLYSISVVNKANEVKHYRIKRMDNRDFYISSKHVYKDLDKLIKSCKDNLILCCHLTEPYKKTAPTQYDINRSTRDKWEIDRELIELKENIGTGNFGEVWRGVFNKKTVVAVKIMKAYAMQSSSFLEEAAVMKQLRHPKLVKLYAVCSDDPIYIITELMTKGCLQNYLKKDGGRTLKENKLIDFGAQVASGMQYIEGKGYVHRDLATRNVLVAENDMVKIGDFGLAKMLSNNVYVASTETKFPVKWTAPEIFSTKEYGIKSDVWAFGILLVELFRYGETPYPGMGTTEIQVKLAGSYRHPKPPNCSLEMYEIMLRCWHKSPEMRPTFESLFNSLDDFLVANELAYA